MMPRPLSHILLLCLLVIISSCKKQDTAATNDCFSNATTTRTVVNADGTIVAINGEFYIAERNTIDTRLFPCNLASEFQVANLPVKFSGEVKNTRPDGPCCTDNFVILKMSR